MVKLAICFAAFLLWMPRVTARTTSDTTDPIQSPSTQPVADQLTSHGCYSLLSATASGTKVTFLSSGSCWEKCRAEKKKVVILHGTECYCADTYPPRNSLVNDDKCDYPCPGYEYEACGGLGDSNGSSKAYSVFNSGRDVDVEYDDSSKTTATSTSPPSSDASSDSSSSASSSSASAASASGSATTASAASDSTATDTTSSVSTTIASTNGPASTPSQSAKVTGNYATQKSSGMHALIGIFLALIV